MEYKCERCNPTHDYKTAKKLSRHENTPSHKRKFDPNFTVVEEVEKAAAKKNKKRKADRDKSWCEGDRKKGRCEGDGEKSWCEGNCEKGRCEGDREKKLVRGKLRDWLLETKERQMQTGIKVKLISNLRKKKYQELISIKKQLKNIQLHGLSALAPKKTR